MNRLSSEKVEALRQAFRTLGRVPVSARDFKIVGENTKVDFRVARKYWTKVFAAEHAKAQELARARLSTDVLKEEAAAAPIKAVSDAAEQIAREAKLTRLAGGGAEALLGWILRLAGEQLPKYIDRLRKEDPATLDATTVIERLEAMMRLFGKSVELGHRAMVMERLRLGEPGSIVGVTPMPNGPVSVAELEAEVTAAARALQRARATAAMEAPINGDESAH